jgi:hypothetical protein
MFKYAANIHQDCWIDGELGTHCPGSLLAHVSAATALEHLLSVTPG